MRAASPTDQLVNDGIAAYKSGDYDTAILKYNEAIKQNPKDATAYNDRGLAYNGKKDFEHAIADFSTALRLKPDWSFYYNRGTAYSQKGDNNSGISDFTKALKLNPKDPLTRADCLLGRAHCYFDKEKAQPAMADLNAAIKLNDREPDAYVLRGILHKVNHDYARSLADYETAIGLNPLNPRSYDVEAYLLSACPMPKYRDAKKAIEYASKACDLTKWRGAKEVETLAAAYAEAGQFDNAIKWQMHAASLDANDIDKNRLNLYQQKQPFRDSNRGDQTTINPSNMQNKVVIKLGQKVTARFQLKDGQPVNPGLVQADGQKPEKTPDCLWLDFRQDKRGRVLFLWHSFPRTMRTKCVARLKEYDTYFDTDIIPVPIKTVSPEIWKEPVEELVLFDLKLE